jgi:hypothetical protein
VATLHELKTSPPYFAAVALGMKTFDIRFNDREFEVGDLLHLREYDGGEDGAYSGRSCVRKITYVMADPQYVLQGSVVLGIALIDAHKAIEKLVTPGCYDVVLVPGTVGHVDCGEHGGGPSTVGGECRFTTAAHIAWYILENPDA